MSRGSRLFKWGSRVLFEERRSEEQAKLAACPEAQTYGEEEVQEFIAAMHLLDRKGGGPALVRRLKEIRLPFPLELTFDYYRLGWYLLHRWGEVRTKFMQEAILIDVGLIRRIAGKEGLAGLLRIVDQDTPPVALWLLRRCGLEGRVPELKAAFSEEINGWYQDMMTEGRLAMNRYLRIPEPPRQASRWEQQKILRRLRLREVQLTSLRRNLRTIRTEQKALVERLRRIGMEERPELNALACELAELRRQRAEAERRHAAALEAEELRHQGSLAEIRAAARQTRRDRTETLTLRKSWVPVRRAKEHG